MKRALRRQATAASTSRPRLSPARSRFFHREDGRSAWREFLGFALPPPRTGGHDRRSGPLLPPRKYFWFWSSKNKNAFSPPQTSRPPCEISEVLGTSYRSTAAKALVRRGRATQRKLLQAICGAAAPNLMNLCREPDLKRKCRARCCPPAWRSAGARSSSFRITKNDRVVQLSEIQPMRRHQHRASGAGPSMCVLSPSIRALRAILRTR
jgi:hypothetical protein